MTGNTCTMNLQVTPDFMATLNTIAKTFSFASTEQALTNAARVLLLASQGAEYGGQLCLLFPDGSSKEIMPTPVKQRFVPILIQGGLAQPAG